MAYTGTGQAVGAYRLDGGNAGDDTLVRWVHPGTVFARVDEIDTTLAEIAGLSMIEILS